MPAEKTCPRCGVTHNKRGPYCSRSCGNVREFTDEDKAIRSKKLLEYHQTPEGAATRIKAGKYLTALRKGEEIELADVEEFAVNIPDVTDYAADYDDTWQRAEKW